MNIQMTGEMDGLSMDGKRWAPIGGAILLEKRMCLWMVYRNPLTHSGVQKRLGA